MAKGIRGGTAITIGLDVSDRFTEAYAIDANGEFVASWRMPTKAVAIRAHLSRYPGSRVVLEVGCHSPWMSRQLREDGFEVIVANPRRVRLIAESDKKSDRLDARSSWRGSGGSIPDCSLRSCTAASKLSATGCSCSHETGSCAAYQALGYGRRENEQAA